MLILTIRTDKPESEIGLFDNAEKLSYEVWQAHRALSSTIHVKIDELLSRHKKCLSDIEGILCFKGPGSFTGLRIGLTVGNSLAYGLRIPIIGATGDDWISYGTAKLLSGNNQQILTPEYGSEPNITQPKK